MFEYIVWWHDCNGVGESESGVQYKGSDRVAALQAKRVADDESCRGSIDIRPLWRKETRNERLERIQEEKYYTANSNNEFDSDFFDKRYEVGDIVDIDDLFNHMGNGFGDPGSVAIGTVKGAWYPAGFCTRDGWHIVDPDNRIEMYESDYGKTWVAVYTGTPAFDGYGITWMDNWMGAYIGTAYLLDVN